MLTATTWTQSQASASPATTTARPATDQLTTSASPAMPPVTTTQFQKPAFATQESMSTGMESAEDVISIVTHASATRGTPTTALHVSLEDF